MGYYTYFSGKISVKPEYVDMICRLCDWQGTPNGWEDLIEDYPFVEEYSKVSRANFIPRGCYAAEEPEYLIDDNNIFEFKCALKDYNGTIKAFMDIIVPVISDKAFLFIRGEDFSTPDVYMFDDTGMVQTEEGVYEG